MTANQDEPSINSKEDYVGVWDSGERCWIAREDDSTSPVQYTHPFFARGMLDMYAGPRWEQQGRYEVRPLPKDTENLPLTKTT